MKPPVAVVRPSLASPVLARTVLASAALVTALAGCASMTQHAATSAASASAPASAGASAATPSQATCLELVSWNQRGASAVKALTAAYAAAGTALANGDATGAVPRLQEGNSAISAFSTATAQCS
jgi:hypothetical protein